MPWLVDRSVVEVSGADATTFLQGQLSADVASLASGEGRPSLLLTPEGKVVELLGVHRLSDGTVVLDVDRGRLDAVLERLGRFRFRVDVEMGVTGHSVVMGEGTGDGTWLSSRSALADSLVLGISSTVPTDCTDAEAGRARSVAARFLAGDRCFAGQPLPGTLGQATVDASSSATKGCYVGQELVARVTSRGATAPWRFVSLRPSAPVEVGDTMLDESGEPCGRVVDAAVDDVTPVAIALVHRRALEAASLTTEHGVRAEVLLVG